MKAKVSIYRPLAHVFIQINKAWLSNTGFSDLPEAISQRVHKSLPVVTDKGLTLSHYQDNRAVTNI